MKKRLYFVLSGALIFGLSGCGKKDVEYVDENIDVTTEVASNQDASTEVSMNSSSIKDELKLGEEWKWKDDLIKQDKTVKIAAVIDVPDQQQMCTLTVKPYFFGNDYKKNVIETLFDKDSASVDVNNIQCLTKENINRFIEQCENSKPKDGGTKTPQETDPDALIEKYTELIAEAPNESDVDTEVGDYSQNCYKASMDGKEYSVTFKSSKEENLSYVSILANDLTAFNNSGVEVMSYTDYADMDNQCSMTEEQAKNRAEEIASQLGAKDFKTYSVSYLQWYENRETTEGPVEINGYRIELERTIAGEFIDHTNYHDEYKMSLSNIYDKAYNYETERLIICLNDNGIARIYYGGIMEVVGEEQPTNLLEFAKIKELAKKYIIEDNREYQSDAYRSIKLEYQRIGGSDGTYTYIPVWKLDVFETNVDFGYSDSMALIWINAIDGSYIDAREAGFSQQVTFYSPDYWFNIR